MQERILDIVLVIVQTDPSPLFLLLAAAAKSLQSCPTLCDPTDSSPLGSSVPGILPARMLEWVAISFSNAWKSKVKVKSFSRAQLLVTPWTGAYQAPSSMGFLTELYLISDGGLVLKFRRQIWITFQRKLFSSFLIHHITICLLEAYLLKDKKKHILSIVQWEQHEIIEIIVQALLGTLQ